MTKVIECKKLSQSPIDAGTTTAATLPNEGRSVQNSRTFRPWVVVSKTTTRGR